MAELLNCPLCDGPGEMKDVHGKFRSGWVGCKACSLYIQWKVSPAGAIKKWNTRTKTETGLFDLEEIYPNCTVQVLKNTDTGETSIGWWPNDRPPKGVKA